MTLTIELTDEQEAQLEQQARKAGVHRLIWLLN
jgi:hypothetical protein